MSLVVPTIFDITGLDFNIGLAKDELSIISILSIGNININRIIDVITYPDRYVKVQGSEAEPVEAVLQIKLKKDKKDQVLKLVFGDNNIEILNK